MRLGSFDTIFFVSHGLEILEGVNHVTTFTDASVTLTGDGG